jgi:LCP family protein required for cell wall assembly
MPWKRVLLGAALVVCATAGAITVAAFHEVGKLHFTGRDIPAPVAPTSPGGPQTILLLGSDRRQKGAKDGGAGIGARSDTIMLVRLDPDRNATVLLSLPRDLRVRIPGHGTGKINAAYELGGAALTVRTVRALMGLEINHVVNVDFQGFKGAVDALGCIYADVDRRYFNHSAAYAYIDLKPGYQRLCGEPALEYARFRHEDSDLVRGARQQQLLTATRQQIGVGRLIGERDRLIKIFAKSTTSDAALKSTSGVLRVLKLAVLSAGHPIREVHFEGEVGITSGDAQTGKPSYVTASSATIRKLRRQFLGAAGRGAHKSRRQRRPRTSGLERAQEPGREQALEAISLGAGGKLPVYYPTVRTRGAVFAGPPRYYKIGTPSHRAEKSYRMVLKRGLVGEYYGVQGTTWKNPPLLDGAFAKKRIGRRLFEVHYDGARVRLVAWRTRKAVYWVSNTLLEKLSRGQMLAIARSTSLP